MSTFDTLPVILVSAVNQAAVSTLLSELIDNDVTDDYLKSKQCPDRVWRLVNKYYTANVRVHSLTDHGQLQVDLECIEAHIIYISKEESVEGAAAAAAAEARACAGAWRRAAVRVLVLDAGAAPAALAAWRGAARAHLVPLRDELEGGVARAREALHAHVWRGLQLTRRAALPPRSENSSSSSGGSDDEEADELRAVEHAEAFAEALGTLGPALARAPPGPGSGPGWGGVGPGSAGADPRHDRAEALVAAFCRALGYDLDAC